MRHRIAATSFQKVSAPKRLTAGPASRLGAYVEMLHLPPILVVVGAATVITATASYPPQMSDLAMFIAALFVSQLAISVHNDYCDRELDAQVKPWRALPRGLVSPAQAVGLVVLLLMSAVAIAAPLGLAIVLLGVVGTGCGLVYNATLKRSLFVWVPFWIALPTLAVACFVLADSFSARVLFAYVVGLPLAVSAYLTDTVGDAALDSDAGVRSLATALGEQRSRLAAWASLAAAVAVGAMAFGDEGSLPLFAAPLVLLVMAVTASRRAPRLHWLFMMSGIVSVAGACAIGQSN